MLDFNLFTNRVETSEPVAHLLGVHDEHSVSWTGDSSSFMQKFDLYKEEQGKLDKPECKFIFPKLDSFKLLVGCDLM